MDIKAPKVFISYSWAEQEFGGSWVENLANRLRADGIDADIDMYHESPSEGWTTWMINKIKNSDYVLVVCTESYYNIVNSGQEIDSGLGRRFEGKLIQKQIYDDGCINERFIPILPPNGHYKHILEVLRDYTPYRIYDDYDKLLNRLKGNVHRMPPLGRKEVKTVFTNLIDHVLWSEAKWVGMSFIMDRQFSEMPIVRFVFDNSKGAERIFRHILNNIGKDDEKQQLGISFVIKDDKSGYYTHIYPIHHNIISKIEKRDNVFIDKCFTISRVREITTKDGADNVLALEKSYKIFNACYVEPAVLINGKILTAPQLRFICRNLKFKKYSEITSDDVDVAVTLNSKE